MSNFCLADACSINLNFLIYVKNLYLNYNYNSESYSKIFPWIPIKRDALLSINDFDTKSKEIWNIILNSFSYDQISYDLNRIDLEYWINEKFLFSDLLHSTASGIEQYQNIKKSFEAWYWGSGHRINNIFSKDIVKNYYGKLIDLAKSQGLKLKDTRIYLQVIYDNPAEFWEIKNDHMIVISPNTKLPMIEDIFDICHV